MLSVNYEEEMNLLAGKWQRDFVHMFPTIGKHLTK